MKMSLMKYFSSCLIVFVLLLSNCQSKKDENINRTTKSNVDTVKVQKEFSESPEPLNQAQNGEKIDMKAGLKSSRYGDYMMDLSDSVFSMVGPYRLFNPLLFTNKSSLQNILPDFRLISDTTDENRFSFVNGRSQIHIQHWEVEKITAEYTEKQGVNISGQIVDQSLSLPNGIAIGMSKEQFLNTYFINFREFADQINQVVSWEDERGEAASIYFFEENRLKKIEFGGNDL